MQNLILLVDDNARLLASMKMRLEMVGYQVLLAYDGRDALEILKSFMPGLIIADVMMPRMTGWELFERVRHDPRTSSIPFVFVTARTDDESIQRAKSLGADDYLIKPFKAEELEATIRGRLLRAAQLTTSANDRQSTPGPETLQILDLVIDLKAHRVFRSEVEISLSPTEFKLLAHLGEKAGQVLSLDELAKANFPVDYNSWGAQDSIRVHIKNLRKKLEADPANPRYIINVRGVGYRMSI